jgi:hypothetical protein
MHLFCRAMANRARLPLNESLHTEALVAANVSAVRASNNRTAGEMDCPAAK